MQQKRYALLWWTSKHKCRADILTALKLQLLHACSAAVREQLSEAIRVVRLTAVSFTYGILAYDALNAHHAREIVRVIVSSDIPTCLADAIQFTKAYSSLPAELVFVDYTEHAMHLAVTVKGETDLARSKRALSAVDDAIHKTFTMLNDNASLNRYVEVRNMPQLACITGAHVFTDYFCCALFVVGRRTCCRFAG